MFGANTPEVGVVFVALAVIFMAATVRNFLKEGGGLTPARNTWLRISFIFSGIAIGIFIWHNFFA